MDPLAQVVGDVADLVVDAVVDALVVVVEDAVGLAHTFEVQTWLPEQHWSPQTRPGSQQIPFELPPYKHMPLQQVFQQLFS
ncbi:hypothetical protein HK096_001013, partial [Nowakowskiella sp. JEL0078]